MARAERIGLAAALIGHALLFAALSLGWPNAPEPPKPLQQPIDVSLAKDVALQSAAPVVAPPAPSVAPEQGPPEDAAPPPEAEEPEPAPPAPAPPKPVPPKPKPAPEKPVPKAEPEPKPVAKPVVKPSPAPKPAKPQPVKAEAKPAKPSPAKPAPAKAEPAKPSAVAATPTRARPAATVGKGSDAAAKTTRPRGSRLGDDFLKGLADAPAKPAPPAAAPAAKIGAQQLANIASAILRQVQPCANRQVTPGPGAERIRVTINLRLNRDGSLAAKPRIVNHDGVDDENQRYLARVDDLAIATFVGCAPLQGLPDSLYDVKDGWSNFTMRYKLPG